MKSPDIFFKLVARPIIFVLVAIGLNLFLRGHNAPGGGFIAGLVVAVAALLSRMSLDRRLLNTEPRTLIPVGLIIAFLTGVIPMVFDFAFLKSAYGYVTWPFVGEFEWATAVAFDIGVFLVVIGTTLTIIDLLAEGHEKTETIGLELGQETGSEH